MDFDLFHLLDFAPTLLGILYNLDYSASETRSTLLNIPTDSMTFDKFS